MHYKISDVEAINIHPLRNDRTTSISPVDLQCFLTHVKHEPTVLDFAAAVPITPPAPPAAKKSGGGKNLRVCISACKQGKRTNE